MIVKTVDPSTIDIPTVVCRLKTIQPAAKLLYGVINACVAADIDPSFERMARWIGIDENEVGPILDELHDEGLIEVDSREGYDLIRLKHHPCFDSIEIDTSKL